MKKRNILIFWILILATIIAYFIYNSKMPLNNIYIWSTFPPEDQKVFEQKLLDFEWKDLTGYADVIEKARMYQYLWYPGKAILVYKEFENINMWEYTSILANMWHLYKDICEVNSKLNRPYCREAISYYNYIINKYRNFNLYKDVSIVYLKLWNKKAALENYKLYQKNTNKWEIWIEKELEILNN